MSHLRHIRDIIGFAPGVSDFAALSLMITSKGAYFLADTQVRPNPSAEEIAEMAVLAADPCAALRHRSRRSRSLSHSDFGSYDSASARKMRARHALLTEQHPELEVDGEMQGDTALSDAARERVLPHSRLKGEANLLIMPNLDAANVAYQMIKVLADALPVGPILIGAAQPGAYPHAVGDRARRRQHDGAGGGRSARRGSRLGVVWHRSVRPHSISWRVRPMSRSR